MAYELLMPQLGLTMEEGTVSAWLKQEGDQIKVGDPILEITTDKLTNEVVSEYEGTLLKIVAQEGEDIPVKGLLGYIGQPGEAVGGAAAPAPAAAETPAAAPAAAAPAAVPAPAAAANGARIRISPLARKTPSWALITPASPVPAPQAVSASVIFWPLLNSRRPLPPQLPLLPLWLLPPPHLQPSPPPRAPVWS